jgi:hypothetical protein
MKAIPLNKLIKDREFGKSTLLSEVTDVCFLNKKIVPMLYMVLKINVH